MTGFNSDSASAPRAKRAIDQLRDLGITPPKPVLEALDAMTGLMGRAPKQPDRGPLVDAITAGNTKKATELAANEAALPIMREAHGAAVARAAHHVLDVLRRNAAPVRSELEKLAQRHASQISKALRITDSVTALVQAGRMNDAHLVATRQANEQALSQLHALADRHLGGHLATVVDRHADAETVGA